jgi:hypothetical protein
MVIDCDHIEERRPMQTRKERKKQEIQIFQDRDVQPQFFRPNQKMWIV